MALPAMNGALPTSAMGHKPPRPPQAGVTGLTPIAAAQAHGWGGRSGPIPAASTCSKNGEPFRRLATSGQTTEVAPILLHREGRTS